MVSGRGESNVLDVIFHRSESKLAQSGDSAEQTTSSGGVNVVHLTTSPKFSVGPILVLRASGARSSAVL